MQAMECLIDLTKSITVLRVTFAVYRHLPYNSNQLRYQTYCVFRSLVFWASAQNISLSGLPTNRFIRVLSRFPLRTIIVITYIASPGIQIIEKQQTALLL